jgi:hypothetical protein
VENKNHPNRNWRAQARQAAVEFVEQHDVLWRFLPTDHAALQRRLRDTFEAGFSAGREQNKPKARDDE